MTTIMSTDYWIKIPAGECQIGLTQDQERLLWTQFRDQCGYNTRSLQEQQKMDEIIEKLVRREEVADNEAKIFDGLPIAPLVNMRSDKIVYVKEFYIMSFPVTEEQWRGFSALKISPTQLPGVFEEPETTVYDSMLSGKQRMFYNRCAAEVSDTKAVLAFCEQLGGRLPTDIEWEKAARGTDGRLYPWGNTWNPEAGFFWYGQKKEKTCSGGKPPVNSYPLGVSPYGVWAMAGYVPERVTTDKSQHHREIQFNGKTYLISKKAFHPRESSESAAMFHHVLTRDGYGDWVGFRPVLDQWPVQQWRGLITSS